MRKVVASVTLVVMLLALMVPSVHAHGGGNAALALGAFALFNVLLLPFALASAAVTPAPVVYTTPAPVYASAPPVYAPPAPAAISREVVYPHGRYLLYGDGMTKPYRWVWVPNPPPPGSAPGH